MELLNNIWSALTTPNETIISIMLMVACFIESFLFFKLFSTLLNLQVSTNKKIIYIILSGLAGIFTTKLLPSPINTFINYFLVFIINLLVFRLSLLKTFIAVFIPIIVFSLAGSLIINPFLTIFHITYDETATIPLYRFLYLIIIYILIGLIIAILKMKNLNLKIFENIDKKNMFIILCNFLLGIITLIIHAILTLYYINDSPLSISFLSFISLLAYLFISIYSLTRVMKLALTTQKLQNAEEYNKTLSILHDSVRGFKHDFDNIVTTIGGYIRTNDMKGLQKYYLELEDDCQKVNNLYILNPDLINNPGVYSLLTTKYYEAESKGIKINMTLLLDLNKLNMKIYEFTRILGILLDNAIDASNECEEKTINIIFRDDSKNHRQLITIENTYKDKNVDTEKIFYKGFTGKENHTGLGLWEVKNILQKNKNISLFTSKTDKYFSQQLEIYY